ncbi:MAG: peptide ABC transporter substrate-binding protein [Woeseiaceae bacterium]
MTLKTLILSCLVAAALFTTGCEKQTETTTPLDPGTVIYRGNGGEPGSLDPALAEDIHAFNILTDIYEGLVAESANGQIVPGVAKSWSVSDDGLVYTFSLRDSARWSNGEALTSDDFVRAFRRVADPATASVYGFLLEPILNFVDIRDGKLSPDKLGVAAVDDLLLEIRLQQPAPQLLAVLAMPVAFPVHRSAISSASFSDAERFVGNGAYTLTDYSMAGPITLRRSVTYWDAATVAVQQIVYLPIVNAMTELNMYRAGEIDITHSIPAEHLDTLRAANPSQVRVSPYLALYYLAFDVTEPPLDDARLRKALNMAIDREALVSLIGRGEQPAYGIVPGGVAGYSGSSFSWENLSANERQRSARALYRDAGFSDTAPLIIHYLYDTEDIHEKVALAISSMWRDTLGVEVTLEKREWQYFLETRDRRSDWQVMRFAWFGDYNHASTFTNIFRTDDPQNLAGYGSEDYDQLLALAAADTDPISQAARIARAEQTLLEDAPVAPLYFYVSKHLVRPGIGSFEHNALDRHPSKYLTWERKPQ